MGREGGVDVDRQDVSRGQIIRGNALALPLADDSVDLVVTSPPYFGLRSYQDGGEHYSGQIGDEPTPAEFVDALIAATAEMVRVLKPSGSIWVNLGDKYASTSTPGPQSQNTTMTGGRHKGVENIAQRRLTSNVPTKSLIGIPWRYALRCIDDLGLILRANVIWSKPNGLPESVTDRVRRSHEDWFHFTLNPRYYSAVDEIREAHVATTTGRDTSGWRTGPSGQNRGTSTGRGFDDGKPLGEFATSPLGKLPGSVWTSDRNDLGESRIGLVLQAVSEGHLTPEEGERILWDGRNDSGPRSTSPASAGAGWASSAATATGATGEPAKATDEHTGSPMNWSEGRSLEGSTSTTSAGTSGASTPTTSSPSLSRRTTPDDLASPSAPQVTRSMSATPTSGETASESAGPACEIASESVAPPSVWVIPTEPLHVPDHLGIDHFAAFPTEWPRRIIQGWSPRGICVECGEGRRPVVATVGLDMGRAQARRAQELADKAGLTEDHLGALLSVGVSDTGRGAATQSGTGKNTAEVYRLAGEAREALGGYAREYLLRRPTSLGEACACPEPTAPTRPGVVLDPFGGTGTTALVAHTLGRHGISVDMSADYCRLAGWRTSDPKQQAKAARREYVPPREQAEGQLDLLEGIA